MKIATILLALILIGCSQEQTNAAANSIGKSYNENYRDNLIENYQAKVTDTPRCTEFKKQFKTLGERYDNASNGAFQMDMIKTLEATKSANCAVSK